MTHNPESRPDPGPNPVLVEVTRGGAVESWHRGAVAVVDAAGGTVFALGAVEAAVYPRSGIKPLQALALLESGAASALAVSEEEIALACASHAAEARQLEIVANWLARIGSGEADLECGPEPPRNAATAEALRREGRRPSPLHNNCSGKHAGFITVARHLGVPVAGYIAFSHPVQQLVTGILAEVFGSDLRGAPRGIDGCGIPVLAVPLTAIARGMARLAAPGAESGPRRTALKRIAAAMSAHPQLIAGAGRFATRVIEASGGRALVKGGAEGVYAAALPDKGLGIALKIDDGAGRAAEVAMGAMLRRFGVFGGGQALALTDVFEPRVLNWAGAEAGRVRPAAVLRDGGNSDRIGR